MRWAIRALVVLVALAGVALGALAIALPRLASSEAVKARLEQAARDATGEDVRWDALGVGLLPPRLVVSAPRIESKGGAPPKLRAERVNLRIALLPLLARTLVIDSLVVDGAETRAVRTPTGIELPIAAAPPPRGPSRPPGAKPPAPPPEGTAPEGKAPLALAVRDLRLARSRLVLEDRSVKPPVTWELSNVEARAKGTSPEAPLDVELSASLASGGTFRVSGTATLDGRIDLEALLDGVRIDPASPYLPERGEAAGLLSGTVRARGPAGSPEALETRLSLTGARVRMREVRVEGDLSARADLSGGLEKVAGDFEIDATAASLAYGEGLSKPRGLPATLSGRIVPGPNRALSVEDMKLRAHSLQAHGRLAPGARTRLELDAPAFPLEGWAEIVPALADLSPGGRLSLQGIVVDTSPLEVHGRVGMEELRLAPPGREPVVLRGALEGAGPVVRSADLRALVAGQEIGLQLELTDLERTPRYRAKASASHADLNALLAALAGMPDTLWGPLDASAELGGSLGGEDDPLRALSGSARLDVGRGRLKGVSLLRGTLERLGTFGEAALLLGAARGGATLQRFYDDEFESIHGTFAIAQGAARTDDLRIVYRNYTVDLRGSVGFLDQRLDLRGNLSIDEEVDAALAGAAEAQAGTTPPPPRRKVIPLAHVGGTLSSPRVDLSREAVVALASSYALESRRGRLEQKIDERLGEGAGRELLDTLEGVLGGKRRSEPPPP